MSVLFFRALLSGWENDPPPIRGLKRIKIVQTFSQIILVTLWRDYFDDLCPGPFKHLKRNLLFNTITTCCGSLVPSTPALNSNRWCYHFHPPQLIFPSLSLFFILYILTAVCSFSKLVSIHLLTNLSRRICLTTKSFFGWGIISFILMTLMFDEGLML